MSTEASKNRILWGIVLLIGAINCASLRNIPAMGISPLVIGIIEGLIFVCLLAAARFSYWQMAAVIGVIVPLYLWGLRFLDEFMIPVNILVNLSLVGGMQMLKKKPLPYLLGVTVLSAVGYVVLFFGSTAAIWIVKRESIVRTLLEAWNTNVYCIFSLLGAAALCTIQSRKE